MDKQYLLNSWLEVFSPTVMGCLLPNGSFDFDRWREWCRSSANAGGNGIRILSYAPWNHPSGIVPIAKLFCPYNLDPVQKAWNLDWWNTTYFSTFGRMVEIASEYNLRIWYSLFDNCQWHHGAGGITPWGRNIQNIDGYYDSLSYALRFVDKVHAMLGKSVNYEIINEGTRRQLPITKAAEWIIAIFDRLIFKGVPAEQICWGPLPSSIYNNGIWHQDREHDLGQHILSITERRDRIQSNKVYRAMHGVGVADETKNGEMFPASYCGEWALQWWGNAHSGKGFLSDDGVSNGGNPLDKLPGGKYQRPSAEQWYKAARRIFKSDGGKRLKWVIERLSQNLDPAVWTPIMQAISKAYFSVYGVWPENYNRFPKPVVPPPIEPPVIPPVIIDDDRPPINWLGEWRNNWPWIVGGTLALVVLFVLIF